MSLISVYDSPCASGAGGVVEACLDHGTLPNHPGGMTSKHVATTQAKELYYE